MNKEPLQDRLIEFACRAIRVSEAMPNTYAAAHLGSQLIRSGTSSALNYAEAQDAESRNDFIHKLKIVVKELRESLVCLKIISQLNLIPSAKLSLLIKENDELIAILVSSLKTARANQKVKNR
jgi:four helix bundle protein